MKIDGVHIAGRHRWQIERLASGIGSGEIESNVIAHHEPHDRQREILQRADTNADDDGGGRFEKRRLAVRLRPLSLCLALLHVRRQNDDRC